jgi:hypothetical protein
MKVVSSLARVAVIAVALSGCSIYKAATQPGPADLTGLNVGFPRSQLISSLGAPKFSDSDAQGRKQDTFEFASGMNQASKIRILPYLAADVFTAGLAELILWPVELTVMDQAMCVATVTYDNAQRVEAWQVAKKGGVQGC